jgi:hypothetical protein
MKVLLLSRQTERNGTERNDGKGNETRPRHPSAPRRASPASERAGENRGAECGMREIFYIACPMAEERCSTATLLSENASTRDPRGI